MLGEHLVPVDLVNIDDAGQLIEESNRDQFDGLYNRFSDIRQTLLAAYKEEFYCRPATLEAGHWRNYSYFRRTGDTLSVREFMQPESLVSNLPGYINVSSWERAITVTPESVRVQITIKFRGDAEPIVNVYELIDSSIDISDGEAVVTASDQLKVINPILDGLEPSLALSTPQS